MSGINILIVEDEPLIAEDIRHFLGNINYSVAGVAYSSSRALDILATRHPDAVLLDISIKGDKDGIEIGEIIRKKYNIPFIYLTSHSDEHTIARAKRTLPDGYLLKPFDERDLLTSLEMAVYRHAQQHVRAVPDIDALNSMIHTALTSKEFELLCAINDGMTNQQMADKFSISINTVKYHLKNLFLKMDVPSRTAALVKFREITNPTTP